VRVPGARRLRRSARAAPEHELPRLTDEDRRYLTTLHDDSVPLPAGAEATLSEANPRLAGLRERYERTDVPARLSSRWSEESVGSFLDLRFFRGETLITWHYRELPRITRLKYFIYARAVAERDSLGLLSRLEEDGAFGCWTFEYPGLGVISRDLLESVNEISFLERTLDLSRRERFSVLDVGAGYGRLGHRMTAAYPRLGDYCCVDAIPECTFLSDYYLGHRGRTPPARVVALDRMDEELAPGDFDLAVNVHSFSECTLAAVEWWVQRLSALRVPKVMIIPNEPEGLLTLEPDGSRRDFAPLLAGAGYVLTHREPVLADPAVRQLLELGDHFHLFSLEG